MLRSLLRRRLLSVLSFIFLTVLLLNPAGMAQAFTVHVVDDAYVEGHGDRDATNGDSPELQVNGGRHSYARFDISKLRSGIQADDVVSATLQLYVSQVNVSGGVRVDWVNVENWDEDTLTFNNRFGYIPGYRQIPTVDRVGDFISVDVTEQLKKVVRNKDYYSILLVPDSSANVVFASKEAGGHAPRIEVDLKLTDSEVTEDKLAADAVTSAKIADGTVQKSDLVTTLADEITASTTKNTAQDSSIASNTAGISTNTTNITANTTKNTAQDSSIAGNTTNISTNAGDIDTNETAIANNTTNIGTNTTKNTAQDSSISTNTTNISILQTAVANLSLVAPDSADGVEITFTREFDHTYTPPGGAEEITVKALDLNGTGLVVDGAYPSVTLGGQTLNVLSGEDIANTSPVKQQVVVDLPGNLLAGNYRLNLSNTNGDSEVFIPITTTLSSSNPEIILKGSNPVTVFLADSSYTDTGATAIDKEDGDISASIVATDDIPSPLAVGTYTVIYNVTDSDNNAAVPVSRTVNVVDGVYPTITLLGDNPVNLSVNDSYTDAGATAWDYVDGDITTDIVTTSTVDTTTAGNYTVKYNVTDSDDNAATEVVRTVNVASCTSGNQTFNHTGANQNFTVPAGCTSLTVKAWGGGGGGGDGEGGGGGYVTGPLSVTPSETLTVIVGGGGTSSGNAFGGGGNPGGGGRSAIRRGSTELITAGAGGGGGGTDSAGGFGGGLTGGDGNDNNPFYEYGYGYGGTQSAGGGNGSQFQGGDSNYFAGGGGGYFGGGAGDIFVPGKTYYLGGGGGSSYVPSGGSTIAGSGSTEGNSAESGGAGRGGNGGDGANGKVIISWGN